MPDLPRALTKEETVHNLMVMRTYKSMAARDALIKGHLRIARSLAMRHWGRHGGDVSNLIAEAFLELTAVTDRVFTMQWCGDDYTAYVCKCIHGHMFRTQLRDKAVPLTDHPVEGGLLEGEHYEEVDDGEALIGLAAKDSNLEYQIWFKELLLAIALTERETAIFELRVFGYSNREIAEQLGVTPMTVGRDRIQIAEKVRNFLERTGDK